MNDTAVTTEARIGLRGLLALHVFTAWNLWMLIGPVSGIVHLFFPPWFPLNAVRMVVRAPVFGSLCLVAATFLVLSAYLLSKPLLRSLGPWPRRLLAIVAILWAPMLCAEMLRFVLMQPALAAVPPECRGTASAFESLEIHLADEPPKQPHAWRVRNETTELWSYRSLRFEPAGAWHGADIAISRCHANDPQRTAPGGER